MDPDTLTAARLELIARDIVHAVEVELARPVRRKRRLVTLMELVADLAGSAIYSLVEETAS